MSLELINRVAPEVQELNASWDRKQRHRDRISGMIRDEKTRIDNMLAARAPVAEQLAAMDANIEERRKVLDRLETIDLDLADDQFGIEDKTSALRKAVR